MNGNRGTTFTKFTKYTVKELESYVADHNACVQKLDWLDFISVLPKYLGNITEGVREYLTAKIGTYDRKVDGILLAFKNTKILSPLAAMRPNNVRLHLQVRADFYVFRPQCGATIEGTAKYVSNNYISAVIYRVFNVTIKLGTQKQLRNISQGSAITVRIKSFDMKSDLPYIEGELIGKSVQKPAAEVKLNGKVMKTEPQHHNGTVETTVKKILNATGSSSSSDDDDLTVTENALSIKSETNFSKRKGNIVKVEDDKSSQKRKKAAELDNDKSDNNDRLLSDEDMEKSINDIIQGVKWDLDDTIDSGCNTTLTNGSSSSNTSSKKRKKKKKSHKLDSMEAAILEKFAPLLEEPEAAEPAKDQEDSSVCSSSKSKSKKNKKKKKSKSNSSDGDDFESQIMASLMKFAGDDVEDTEPEVTETPKKSKGKSRKSVRFDDTITEALYNTFDASELLEISQLQAPALSSTLNDCGDSKHNSI